MWKSGGLRVALAGVVAVVLAGTMAVGPAWADCVGPNADALTGNLLSQLGGAYLPGCSSVVAFDSGFAMVSGTCMAGPSANYSISFPGAVGPNVLVIITWAAGPNGTPNSTPFFLHNDYDTPPGDTTCTHDFTANTGPLAVTLNHLTASEGSGQELPLSLAALSLVAAAVLIGRRRFGKNAPDA